MLLLGGGGRLFHITRTKKLLSVFRLTAYKSLFYCRLLPVIPSLPLCIICCQGIHSSLKFITFSLMYLSITTLHATKTLFWLFSALRCVFRISFLKLMNYGTESQSLRTKNYSTKRNLNPQRWVFKCKPILFPEPSTTALTLRGALLLAWTNSISSLILFFFCG